MNPNNLNATVPTYFVEYTCVEDGYTIFRELEIQAFNAVQARAIAEKQINRYPYLQPKIYSIVRM